MDESPVNVWMVYSGGEGEFRRFEGIVGWEGDIQEEYSALTSINQSINQSIIHLINQSSPWIIQG